MAAPSFLKKDPSKQSAKKQKTPKAPKEKKPKAPKAPADPNAPQKNFLGREKKKPREEYEAEIQKLKQELAYKEGELNQLKQWARSAPIRQQYA